MAFTTLKAMLAKKTMKKATLKEQAYILLIKMARSKSSLERVVLIQMISEIIEKL